MFYIVANPKKGGHDFIHGPYKNKSEADWQARIFRGLKKSGALAKVRNPIKVKNVAAGFYDSMGIFHPIRASFDYSASRVSEKRAYKSPKAKKAAASRWQKKYAPKKKRS